MAVDEALARTLPEGEAALRIYRWIRPTLSFGRNQPAAGRYDSSLGPTLGCDFVRRPTGGREVLHDRELTYSVVLRHRAMGGPREVYSTVNQALVAAVRSLGIAADLAPPAGRAPSPDAGVCFGEAAEGEVVVSGRKLVGSAQARVGGSLLQHGSLLLAPSTLSIGALAAPPREGVENPDFRRDPVAITVNEALTESVGFERVAAAVEAGFAGTLGGQWSRGELLPAEREAAEALLERYDSPAWTWRR